MIKKGKCVIFSAPSGAGKTSIVNHLLSKGLNLEFSISACSRGARGNEKDGKEYYFLGKDKFKELIRNDEFIEWEEVYRDNFYGTLKSEINRIWNSGKTVIFDVDVIGGLNLKKEFQKNALAIFVQPPSYQDLETRLRLRKTESEEKIKQRIAKARKDLSFASEFDFILVNNDLLEACKQAEALIKDFIVKQ